MCTFKGFDIQIHIVSLFCRWKQYTSCFVLAETNAVWHITHNRSFNDFNSYYLHLCSIMNNTFNLLARFKGIVSTKNFNSVINYSASCRSKPVRPSSFIFGTQIKMLLMKSESFLALHRQQRKLPRSRPKKVVRTLLKQSMWHQWFNLNFMKLRECFLCAKKTKIITYIQQFLI